jgi:hypothetical protein
MVFLNTEIYRVICRYEKEIFTIHISQRKRKWGQSTFKPKQSNLRIRGTDVIMKSDLMYSDRCWPMFLLGACFFLAYLPYFKVIKEGLWDHLAVCSPLTLLCNCYIRNNRTVGRVAFYAVRVVSNRMQWKASRRLNLSGTSFYIGYEVLTSLVMKSSIFRDITPYSLLKVTDVSE